MVRDVRPDGSGGLVELVPTHVNGVKGAVAVRAVDQRDTRGRVGCGDAHREQRSLARRERRRQRAKRRA